MESQALRHQLSSLNEVSKTLMECESIEDAVQKALAEVRQRLNVKVASIFLFSNNGVIKRVGINGVDKNGNLIGDNWFPNENYNPGESFSGKAVPPTGLEFAFGEPHYSNNIFEEYPGMNNGILYREMLGELKCGISVPLNGLNRTFGTLEVLNSQDQHGFTSDDIYWLMLIGTNLANFLSFFRRREKQKLINLMIEKFISLALIDKNFDLKEVYQFVADALVGNLPKFYNLTTFKACIIRLVNENEDLEIKAKSHTNDISWEARKDGSVKAGSHIVGEVYRTSKPCFIVDIDSEIDKFNNKEWIKAHKLKSFACLPLSVKNECVGTISIYTNYSHYFFGSNKIFLEGIAFLTAAIMARVRIVRELQKVRRELNAEREKVLNASLLVGYDSLLSGFLHQYKNELTDFYQILKIISNSQKSQKEKELIIDNKLHWIKKRVDELKTEFKQDNFVAVEINNLIKDAVKLILSEDKEIEVIEKYDVTIPIILIDESKIRHVIYNLLSNAVVAINKSNRKNGHILVKTDIITAERIQYIQIVVEDNGIGIPHENYENIFEQGFTTRRDEGGTGMGLYITHEILEDYGGKVYFDSKVGKGTKFFVQIPLKRYLV